LYFRPFAATLFGISWGQGGFVQHDLGHNSSFTKASKYNYPVHVFIFNGMMGGSADWWRGRHTRHHAYPNHADTDLDVRTLPLFAWDDQQLNMAFQKGLTNLKYQQWYFTFFGPPLIFVFYRILTLMWTIRNRMVGELATQIFWIVWQAALLLPKMEYNLVAYFTWHMIVLLTSGTYLGWVFALNHTMFPVVRGPKDKDWVRSTCDATQNIVSPNNAVQAWLDWFTGHLDYQVEHHLFPNMLKPILQKHGVPLHESPFWSAVGQVFATLRHASDKGVKLAKEAAASKRAAKQDQASVVDSDKSAVNNTRKTASLLR
jgi:fatty acid desaturase